ncbi:MAG: cysteine dioxygenase type [Rhizorhabdus sp.]|nr:cysteine dioxygenase type [Rhizorhabdus sp.]
MNASVSVPVTSVARLRQFVGAFAELIDEGVGESLLLQHGADLLRDLVIHDDWLPSAYAQPDPARYRQYLLHCDSRERFSVVSFVWGPGQATPVHDHRIWGLVGVLRGAELVESFARDTEGRLISHGPAERLDAGAVDAFGPAIGDIHRVANAYDDQVSISIHVYGANIGAVERATYDADGQPKRFISGYANESMPNLWDRSTT